MQYQTTVSWKNDSTTPFNAKSYDRTHIVLLGSGTQIKASSAPEFLGNPQLANPEELFTAAISSCFMLTFLYWAAVKGVMIEEYTANTIGTLAKNEEGKMAMTNVVIKPQIRFLNDQQPTSQVLDELFKKAHENCFISSSVKTDITVEWAG